MSAHGGSEGVEKVVIVGSGPAGWTAAIYAARAGLSPVVVEGAPSTDMIPGGQLMFTTEVENYPGFPHGVTGQEMMDLFRQQAERFETRIVSDDVSEIDFTQRPFVLKTAWSGEIKAHSIILATGARARWVGLENERRLARHGGGVSACAVCDGALPAFRDKHLIVVGGGDTAMEEAIYLTKFAGKVTLVHRRDSFRASKIMAKRALENPKIEVAWNSVVTEVYGGDFVTGVQLTDTVTGATRDVECGGMFVAIGHSPNTEFLKGAITTDEQGYVVLSDPGGSATNIEGVFAVGDVADKVYRQAITAAGMGCKGAIDAERWLAAQGIH
jgi:thioredoxin reductase (NADPH)